MAVYHQWTWIWAPKLESQALSQYCVLVCEIRSISDAIEIIRNICQTCNSFILSVLCIIYTLNVWTTLKFIINKWVLLCGLVVKLNMCVCVYTTQHIQQCWWVAGLSCYKDIPHIIIMRVEFKYWSYLLIKSQNTESLQPSSVILSGSLIVLVILSMRSSRSVGWLLEVEMVLGSGQNIISGRAKAQAQGPSLLNVSYTMPLSHVNP